MVTSFNTRSALRLALIATATVSMAACASKPKPTYPTTAPTPAPAPAPDRGPAAPPPGPVTTQPLPGSEQDFVINVGDRVYFDFDRYEVRSDATALLDAQAGWLKRFPAVQVRIEGNCDERGTREYNFALGARRASTVRDYLIARGVAGARITTISYGKERPIDPGSDEQAWARNRNARTAITDDPR